MIVGSNLAKNKIKLSFYQIFFWRECERQRKTLDTKKGSLVGVEKYFANGYWITINQILIDFRLWD